jgi:hypothetical protein
MSVSTKKSDKLIAIDSRGRKYYFHNSEPTDEDDDLDYKQYKLTKKEAQAIQRAIEDSKIDSEFPDYALKYYIDLKKKHKNRKYKEIDLDKNDEDLVFTPTPLVKKNQVDTINISGPSGCGKSTYIRNYVDLYHALFPENSIYLFSYKDNDEAFEDLEKEGTIERINLDELEELDLNIKVLENSLCIFDDFEGIPDKNIKKILYTLKNNIQTKGRSKNIYTIEANHVARAGADTKIGLLEANGFVFFNCAQNRNRDIILKEYANLNKDQIKEILDIKSHWYYIHNHHPMYLITEKKIKIL